jgi:hypothetical protein
MKRRQQHTAAAPIWDPTAAANRRLCGMLATLHDAPAGTAEATLGLLPFDLRSTLVRYAFIDPVPADESTAVEIRITDRGRAAIAECARIANQPRRVTPVRSGVPTTC